jgi:hypothetical protein
MKNKASIEKLARRELRGDVTFQEEIQYGEAGLSIWRSVPVKPSNKVVILECSDGSFVVPSRDIKQFEQMLTELQPSLEDSDDFIKLFTKAFPSRRQVLFRRDQVLEKYHEVWQPIEKSSSGISFYCNDSLKGTFELITVSPEYDVKVKVLGPDRKYKKR